MRAEEASVALGVSRSLLHEWTKADTVPHIKVGGVLLYPVDALRKWLADESLKQAQIRRGAQDQGEWLEGNSPTFGEGVAHNIDCTVISPGK